jgi:hypothetical protein
MTSLFAARPHRAPTHRAPTTVRDVHPARRARIALLALVSKLS